MPDEALRKPTGPQPEHGTPGPVADQPVIEDADPAAGEQSPLTDSGLPVAEQIRKEWDPNKDGGLPTPLDDRRRAGGRR